VGSNGRFGVDKRGAARALWVVRFKSSTQQAEKYGDFLFVAERHGTVLGVNERFDR